MLRHVLFSTALVGLLAAASQAQTPIPLHRWSFNNGTANDSIGTANGTLINGATISGGKLQLDGINDYMQSGPTTAAITAKTLVSWVTLSDLPQTAGGALTLETAGGGTFDSIVYAERTANQWMNGSNGFSRSNPANNGGALQNNLNEVMMAITYAADGTITLYRDGALYASQSPVSPVTYGVGSDMLIGLRHLGAGGDPYLAGQVNEARVYGSALTAAQIQDLFAAGPNALATPEPATLALWTLLGVVGVCAWRGFCKRQN